MPADFYELLGVDDDASQGEVKRAFRERAREFHPDVNDHPRAGEQFKTLNTAYEVLSSAKERTRYDRLGHRSYVDQHLDGLPTMSVPDSVAEDDSDAEPEAKAGDDSATDEATGGSGDIESSTTAESSGTGGSSPGAASRSTTGTSQSSTESAGRTSTRTSTVEGSSSADPGTGSNEDGSSEAGSSGSGHSSRTVRTGSTDSTSSETTPNSASSGTTAASTGTSSTGASDRRAARSEAAASTTSNGAAGAAPGRSRTASSRSSSTGSASASKPGSRTATAESRRTGTERRRKGLLRGWIATLLALTVFLSGVGALLAEESAALVGALAADPVDVLTGASPLADPLEAVVAAAQPVVAGGVPPASGLLAIAFGVGSVGLPLVVGLTVWRYGRGTAYLYPLATTLPLLWVVGRPFAPTPLAADLLLLLVVPVGAALTFVGDIGRYLFAS